MKSSYKCLGNYITEINVINTLLGEDSLKGISSIYKCFMASKANTVGVDFADYKVVEKGQFAYNPNTARMGDKIPVALNDSDTCIVSKIYPVFKINDENQLMSEYLMMWFRRPEFDRYARFKSHGSAREIFDWEEMCNTELPVPLIDVQREIVAEYRTILHCINLNNRWIQKLEETAQAIYKQWFVDFEFPNENSEPYKSAGGEMAESELGDIPKGWNVKTLDEIMCIKHGFAFKGEHIIEEENNNILLTPGNVRIGGGFKGDNFKYYNGHIPKEYVFKTGDLMVTMTDLSKAADTIGYSAIIPEIKGKLLLHNQRLGKITPKYNLQHFIYWTMRSSNYRKHILSDLTGTTVKHTSPSKILRYSLPICNNEYILDKFEGINSNIQKVITQFLAENSNLILLRDLVLSKLATVTD